MFGCFVMIKLSSQSFTIDLKDPFFATSHYLIKKMDHSSSKEAASNTYQNLKVFDLTEFILNPFIEFFHFAKNFFERSDIVDMLKPIAWDISLTIWRELCSTSVFRCWSSTEHKCPQPYWSSRFVYPQQNYWNQRLTVRSQVDPWPHALLILAVV